MDEKEDETRPGAGAQDRYERLRDARTRRDGEAAPTAYEEAWRKGAEGERLLGEALNAAALASERVTVLHDLTLRGRRANIDHLVIGPSGVTVIDAKAWSGPISFGRGIVWQGRRPRPRAFEGVRHQVHRVCSALAVAGRDDVPVQGALCFVNGNRGVAGRGLRRIDGIAVGAVREVVSHSLAEGPFDAAAVRDLHAIVAAAFIVRGGVTAPPAAISVPPPSAGLPRPTERVTVPPPRRRFAVPWRRALRLAAVVVVAVIGLSIVAALIGAGVRSVADVTHTMTRSELREQLPDLRRLARFRARGAVHGPVITTSSAAFTLRYRRGRCNVRITVARTWKALHRPEPVVTSSGCRHR